MADEHTPETPQDDDEERSDRDPGGPTGAEPEEEGPHGGAHGDRETPGFEPHE
jgi:hypothetical protein